MLRGKDRRLVELKAVLEFWRSFTRQHPELEDRVFREVLWNHLHGEVSTQIGISRVTGIARRRCCSECMNWRSLGSWSARTGAITFRDWRYRRVWGVRD
jgi:hypothetical protein